MATEILLALGITSLLLAYVAAAEPPKFAYAGLLGPSNWGRLSPAFNLCSTGIHQSPIDIVKSDAKYDLSLESLKRDYVDTNATLINNGFNVELMFEQGVGDMLVDGKNYSLLQVHWHSPSEHTINGERYPLELHLVHKTQEGNIAVVAVLYEHGRPDPFLHQLKGCLEKLELETRQGDQPAPRIPCGVVKTKALACATRKYYRYVGSLTTPPCTEKVIWSILGKVRQMSPQQVDALKAPLMIENRDNARPSQALNGRIVKLYYHETNNARRHYL